jgi:hypothetical protein
MIKRRRHDYSEARLHAAWTASDFESEGREFESLRARHGRTSLAPALSDDRRIGVSPTGGTKVEITKNYNSSAGFRR